MARAACIFPLLSSVALLPAGCGGTAEAAPANPAADASDTDSADDAAVNVGVDAPADATLSDAQADAGDPWAAFPTRYPSDCGVPESGPYLLVVVACEAGDPDCA